MKKPKMPDYPFTDDDRMMPVYCIRCRNKIPRAESDAGKGFCQSCRTKNSLEKDSKPVVNKKSWIDNFDIEIWCWILGPFVFLFWVGAQVQQNDRLKSDQVQQNDRLKSDEREKYERQTVIYKCEYCGEEFWSTRGKGKPHAYEISYCNAVKSGVHTLFEKKQD